MRSLVIATHSARTIKGKKAEARYTGLAVRPEELEGVTDGRGETVYLASEAGLPDGGVEVQVFVGNAVDDYLNAPVASFKAPPEPPFELPGGKHIVDFRYLAETNSLAITLAGGDIVVVNLEENLLPGQEKVEVVGSVEVGIKAAAWSPDEELLILVTGENNMVEMTKTFDVLTETPLQAGDFGEDAPVNVGWGHQSTQFHGSIGKTGRDAVAGLPAAAGLSQPSTSKLDEVPSDATKDDAIRISWRGDGAFFVISTLFDVPRSNDKQRRLRFYSRIGVLQSTSEPTPALEGNLAWQPSGSIVAATAVNSTQVVFFERNGLRRYEFSLKAERPEHKSIVRQLAWNVDSTILAVSVDRTGVEDPTKKHCVQLWRRNNYHWYLKQTIFPQLAAEASLESVQWHTENALCMYILGPAGMEQRLLSWQVHASRRMLPHDSGAVGVIDGSRILFTPFRHQNIPPPMSSLAFEDSQGQTPVDIAFSDASDLLAALMSDGCINVWRWIFAKGNKSTMEHLGRFDITALSDTYTLRQIVLQERASTINMHLLGSRRDEAGDSVVSVSIGAEASTNRLIEKRGHHDLRTEITSMMVSVDAVFLQDVQGQLLSLDGKSIVSLPECCPTTQILGPGRFLGLSESGRLYLNERLLASGCTSFATGGDFLIYTTLQHEARFLLLDSLTELRSSENTELAGFTQKLKQPDVIHSGEEKDPLSKYGRRVERGARIVTAVPSSMSLILQMPRGNLETISPRPLVLQVVRRHISGKNYREAFSVCRRHRIDLNILCDCDYEAFLADMSIFVEQVKDVDYLNLFVSGLKNEDITHTMYASLFPRREQSAPSDVKIDDICKKLRSELETRDLVGYTNTIVTTYACQKPPDLESALRVVTKVKAREPKAAEDAVKYVIFLADANILYNVALGMYDFELVLAIAQNSQKDPREYIPFLRELRTFEKYYQRFKIDDHLDRHPKALSNLSLAGSEHFSETLDYMQRYELYDEAVTIYRDRHEQLSNVLDLRGDWLMRDNRCHEAALSYSLSGKPRKAMVAHQKALTWVELFEIALLERLSAEEIGTLATNVAAALRDKRRFEEAGRILLEYGRNVKEAVGALCEGGHFAEALRIASLYSLPELVHNAILPAVLESKARLLEEREEVHEQVEKQISRLAELRIKRTTDAAGFYGKLLPEDGDDVLDNVDMATDAGTNATTQFTRYTAAAASTRAGTVKSGVSRKTARKQMRKAASGAKGSIFEESYLLGSLARLVAADGRLATLVAATAALTRVLVRLSGPNTQADPLETGTSLIRHAKELEEEVAKLVIYITRSIDETWAALGDAKLHDLDTAMLADAEPSRTDLEALKAPEKPKIAALGHWQVGLLGLLEA